MAAYKAGIIDKNGKRVIDPETGKPTKFQTQKDKESYTLLHRLVFNLKRIINKVPFGKTAFASYAVALLLLKESENLDEDQMEELCEKFYHQLKKDDLLFAEMISECTSVGSLVVGQTYNLRTSIKQNFDEDLNTKVYQPRSEIEILQEHSNVFGINTYIGFIGDDRVIVTAEDVY